MARPAPHPERVPSILEADEVQQCIRENYAAGRRDGHEEGLIEGMAQAAWYVKHLINAQSETGYGSLSGHNTLQIVHAMLVARLREAESAYA